MNINLPKDQNVVIYHIFVLLNKNMEEKEKENEIFSYYNAAKIIKR